MCTVFNLEANWFQLYLGAHTPWNFVQGEGVDFQEWLVEYSDGSRQAAHAHIGEISWDLSTSGEFWNEGYLKLENRPKYGTYFRRFSHQLRTKGLKRKLWPQANAWRKNRICCTPFPRWLFKWQKSKNRKFWVPVACLKIRTRLEKSQGIPFASTFCARRAALAAFAAAFFSFADNSLPPPW